MITNRQEFQVSESTFQKFKYVFVYSFDRDKFLISLPDTFKVMEQAIINLNSTQFLVPFFAKNQDFATPYFKHSYHDLDSNIVSMDVMNGSNMNGFDAIFVFKPDNELTIEEINIFCSMFHAVLVSASNTCKVDGNGYRLTQVNRHEQVVANKEIRMFEA